MVASVIEVIYSIKASLVIVKEHWETILLEKNKKILLTLTSMYFFLILILLKNEASLWIYGWINISFTPHRNVLININLYWF